jgi:hypothetical protein
MPDPTISNLLRLLSVVASYTRAVCFCTIKDRASSKKHIAATTAMIMRLCRLGYVRIELEENCESKFRITDDGKKLLTLPLFERHTEFLHRKESHPEGRKCYVCGFSGAGLTRFQKKDYCTDCLNTAYEPTFIHRSFSALAWEV